MHRSNFAGGVCHRKFCAFSGLGAFGLGRKSIRVSDSNLGANADGACWSLNARVQLPRSADRNRVLFVDGSTAIFEEGSSAVVPDMSSALSLCAEEDGDSDSDENGC